MKLVNQSMKLANQQAAAGWSFVSSVPLLSSLLPTVYSVSLLDRPFTAHHIPRDLLITRPSLHDTTFHVIYTSRDRPFTAHHIPRGLLITRPQHTTFHVIYSSRDRPFTAHHIPRDLLITRPSLHNTPHSTWSTHHETIPSRHTTFHVIYTSRDRPFTAHHIPRDLHITRPSLHNTPHST